MAWVPSTGAALRSVGVETWWGEGDAIGLVLVTELGLGLGPNELSMGPPWSMEARGRRQPGKQPVASNTTGPLTLGLIMARSCTDTLSADASQTHPSLRDCSSVLSFLFSNLLHEKDRGHHPPLQA
jgi:hypothetical protein